MPDVFKQFENLLAYFANTINNNMPAITLLVITIIIIGIVYLSVMVIHGWLHNK